MADLMPKNHDEVLVTLIDKSLNPPKFPSRKLSLTAAALNVQVGRSSSRLNADLSASPTNAWFDNAVMSREHAEIIWDPDTQLVSVRDTGSLHGTSLNGFQLPPWTKKRIQVGDVLKFGARVEKDEKAYYPSEVQISTIDLGPPTLPLIQPRTNTFTVPDDSEPEEIIDGGEDEGLQSDNDDGGVARSALLLQQAQIQQVEVQGNDFYPPTIDLTEDQQKVVRVEEPRLSPTDQHSSSAAQNHQTQTTTFAPALRFHDDIGETNELHGATLPSIAVNYSHPKSCGCLFPSPKGASLQCHADSDNDSDVLRDSLMNDDTLLPSSPKSVEPNNGSEITAQSIQKIVDRMGLRESPLIPDQPTISSNVKETSDYIQQTQSASRGQKRKLAEFSLPEISLTQAPHEAEVSGRVRTVTLAQLTTSPSTLPRPEPPRKRMRQVAEAVGYAALGGLAVMSALIATAPDL